MSYETYQEFDDEMSDILSSGQCFEMSTFHITQIKTLISEMDHDRVVEDLNIWYANQEPSDLREGELGHIAEMIGASVSVKIVFE